MHSVHSDGCHEPAELAVIAREKGLRAISLTDHDTMDGWDGFSRACGAEGLEAIAGVELSAHSGKRDTHILGYFVDPESAVLVESLERFRNGRAERARRIVEQLNGIGVDLEFNFVQRVAGAGAIGRPHIADALVQSGFVATFDEAFRKYIGIGKPGYAPKIRVSVAEAIALIHEAGGLAVLAHPSSYFAEHEVEGFVDSGLDGIEIIHPRNRAEHTRKFRKLAERRGILVTGGSDFHGADRGDATIGNPSIPYEFVEKLRERHVS
jgi:predicted metal-dependent phosphoesterase TrpH